MLRLFITANMRASQWIDRRLPDELSVDGNSDFPNLVRNWIKPGSRVVDVGGGKHPYFDVATKESLRLHVTGVDISAKELEQAPTRAYDETLCEDIASVRGNGTADFLICRAVLEHVKDTPGAFRAMASMLKPGGVALIFVPSRNACYARLNLILPENVKRAILFTIYPHTRSAQGFVSYYSKCTPRDFSKLAERNGLCVAEARYYFVSSYFMPLVPVFALWRLWTLAFRAIKGNQAAETFAMALRKASALPSNTH